MRICSDFDLLVNYIFYWWSHFQNQIPIVSLFINWKCTNIYIFRPSKWRAFNIGFMDKQPSRLQEQCFFFNSWASVLGRVKKISKNICGAAPARICLSLQVSKGDFHVRHGKSTSQNARTTNYPKNRIMGNRQKRCHNVEPVHKIITGSSEEDCSLNLITWHARQLLETCFHLEPVTFTCQHAPVSVIWNMLCADWATNLRQSRGINN